MHRFPLPSDADPQVAKIPPGHNTSGRSNSVEGKGVEASLLLTSPPAMFDRHGKYVVNVTPPPIVKVKTGSHRGSPPPPRAPPACSPCWRRRTSLEKTLLLLLFIIFVFFLVIFVVLCIFARGNPLHFFHAASEQSGQRPTITEQPDRQTTVNDKICSSASCVKLAHRLMSNMDDTVDPCEDFYHYACGGWIQKNTVPAHEWLVTLTTHEMKDVVDKQLQEAINNLTRKEIPAFRKLKIFYDSCMDSDIVSLRGSDPVSDLLVSLGGIYNEDTWYENSWDLTGLLLKLFQVNGAPLFDVTVELKNATVFIIMITLPSLHGLESEFISHKTDGVDFHDIATYNITLLEEIIETNGSESLEEFEFFDALLENHNLTREMVFTFIQDTVGHKGLEDVSRILEEFGDAKDESHCRDVVNFLKALAKLLPSQKTQMYREQEIKIYNRYTIPELQTLFPHIDWKRLISTLFNKTIVDDEIFYVSFPDYMSDLSSLLFNTDKRVINNGLIVAFVQDVLLELTQVDEDGERSKFCISACKSLFGEALSAAYLRRTTKLTIKLLKNKIEKFFNALKTSFMSSLEENDWLDPPTRKLLIKKASFLDSNLVASEVFWNDTFINRVFESVKVDEETFFENVIQMYKKIRKERYSLYSQPVDQSLLTWTQFSHPFVINAFYLRTFNKIIIPLGLLNDPFYSEDAPDYLNFGSLGPILGHEIIHAFDNAGRWFDLHGNQRSWWSNTAEERFALKAKCFQDLYSNSFEQEIFFLNTTVKFKFDGNFTLNENIADNGGLKFAFESYRKWAQEKGADDILPGLNMNQEQLFFLNAAQVYCASLTPTAYVYLIELDEHMPHPERINGMMMNSQHFSDVFQCSSTSHMNPEDKCHLW